MRRTKWGVFALAAGLTAVLAHYQHAKPSSAAPAPVLSQPPAKVYGNTLRVAGTVVALKSATLTAPRIAGSRSGLNRGGDATPGGGARGGADFNLVLVNLAKPGSPVKTGEVVARFDSQNQQERLDDYRDTVVQLENNIQSMLANLTAIKDAHDQSVRQAKADWDKAVMDLQTAPALSAIDVEKGKLAAEEDEATYRQLVAESALVEESQRAQIHISELNLDQARIELQRAASNVDKMTIRAPMDGIVVMASIVRNGEYGQIREGDQINAGQPFLSIVDPAAMALNAVVNQVDAERLALGMKATVRLDAYPEVELPGTLVGLGALARASTFRANYVAEIPIRIRIGHTGEHLIPDLTGSAELRLP